MPFTLAHPAAVLPLRGVWRLRSAPLIVGAMVPDLPYYLPGGIARYVPVTHALAHSFSIDLLLGYLVLAALFVLQRPLTALLAQRARALCLGALAPFRRPFEWALAAPAIVLGVWSHLLWDSFTHGDGWMVQRVAALSTPLVVGPFHETVFHALQYLSSAVGLCILVLWYDSLPAPTRERDRDAARSAAAPVLLLAAAAALLIGGVQGVEQYGHSHSVYRTLDVLLTRGIAWFGALYLTAGIVLTLEHRPAETADPGG
ncbi:MAG: DUF4184 family protein [Gammaproteobacteria bacterium]|nr:DUF4184 family protein [Gammaproteobacteria bacterium]MBV8402733.1 DUF4184 family protein [Gammaproteobacteria bacterium]